MKVIGLTGGLAMGKTTAGLFLRRAHLPVFDADAVVHRLESRGGAAVGAIGAAFPGTVRDGAVDRSVLRATIARDPRRLKRLEAILHPLVRAEERAFLARARRAGVRAVILEIPLLFETGADRRVDHIVAVSAPSAVQGARLARRRGLEQAEAAALIARQMPDRERRRRAHVVIRTGLSRHHAVRALSRLILELCR